MVRLRFKTVNKIMHLAGTWMTEKSFAATPYSCHGEILDLHIIMQTSIESFIMASNKALSKLKDFEGIHDPAYQYQLHFWLIII